VKFLSLLDLILTRRSIRRYEEKDIPETPRQLVRDWNLEQKPELYPGN